MAAIPLSENELRARSWHLSAQICLESHTTSNHIEYVRGRMRACLPHMREKSRSMLSLQLLSFITPRQALDCRTMLVFVILHCWRSVGFFTVEALLNCLPNDPIKFTVMSCTPLDMGQGIRCPDFTRHSTFTDFVCMSSKDTSPHVDSNLLLRVDIEGDSDVPQACIASEESLCQSWTFNTSFDYFLYHDLVESSPEVEESIVRSTINQSHYQTVEKKVELFSFAMPQKRSSFPRFARHDWRPALQGTVQNANGSIDFSGAGRSHCVLDVNTVTFGLWNFGCFSFFVQGFFHPGES